MFYLTKTQALKILQRRPKWNILRSLTQGKVLPQITIDKEGRKAEVILPGHSYTDLDRVGNVNIWSVPHMCEFARISVYTHGKPTPPALVNLLKDAPDQLVVLGAARYEISEALYDHRHYYNPIRYQFSLAHLGQTSYQQYGKAYSTVTGDLLYTDSIFNILMDKNTRRPSRLGDDFKDYFSAHVCGPTGIKLDPVRPLVKPENTFKTQTRLEWNQSDYFYHTNQSEYVKVVYDAATVFGMENKFKRIRGDLANRKVHMIEMIYKGETFPGDVLDVHVWEVAEESRSEGKETNTKDGGDEKTSKAELGFQIENKGKVAFQCRMELL